MGTKRVWNRNRNHEQETVAKNNSISDINNTLGWTKSRLNEEDWISDLEKKVGKKKTT